MEQLSEDSEMVAVGLREETTTRSTMGLLSLDSMAVQTQNCTLSAGRNDFKRGLFLFGLKSRGRTLWDFVLFSLSLGPCPQAT